MKFHSQLATYVSTVQLKTENLERALLFYQDILGFKILKQDSTMAKLTADGQTAILSLVQPANIIPKADKTAGLYHFAILLPERSDLALLVTHLTNQGIRFGASNHLVSEAIYFEDPDGNGIEVYADTDTSTWDWNKDGVNMATIRLDIKDLLASASHLEHPWDGLPEKTIIGHIHLHVSELQKAEQFYTEGLGFDVVARYRDSALFLSTAKYHHHIALNTWNGVGAPPAPKNCVGLDFFTLVFPDNQSLKKAVANLEAMGTIAKETAGTLAVEDPSGNLIQLTFKKNNL